MYDWANSAFYTIFGAVVGAFFTGTMMTQDTYWGLSGEALFSILIGAGTILLLYLCLELVFPTKTLIVVGAAAFAALLPMHVAMSAAVNNDGLAELLVMASMLVALVWMRARFYGSPGAGSRPGSDRRERRMMVTLGLLLGLGMLTKVYTYAMAPILLSTVVIVVWLRPRAQPGRGGGRAEGASWLTFWAGGRLALWALIPALALGSLWWIRNSVVYGEWDMLGLAQHGRVVVGQPLTVDWIAINGWVAYGERAFSFTFRSFWGVFGWMGVFMDQRIYTAFLVFTGIIFLGVLWAVVRLISGRPDADMDLFQLWVLGLFGVTLLAVSAAYLWYNVDFVQHQGRYFFWGLLPISTIVALGWREVMQPLQGIITALLGLVLAACTALAGYVTGTPGKWTVFTIGVMALVLLFQPLLLIGTSQAMMKRLPATVQDWLARPGAVAAARWARAGLWALPFVALFVLDLTIPNAVIVPQFAR